MLLLAEFRAAPVLHNNGNMKLRFSKKYH